MEQSNADTSSARPLAPGEKAVVTLTIPCSPEYVGTARLTLLGIASRMGFTYDQVEDIRLAVGEACANAIERAGRGGANSMSTITIRSHVEAGCLTIEIEDEGAPTGGGAPGEALDTSRPVSEIDGMNSQELGALLMEILVDQVTVEPLGNGTRVRLVKYAGEGAGAA